jgi:hypothetical protein
MGREHAGSRRLRGLLVALPAIVAVVASCSGGAASNTGSNETRVSTGAASTAGPVTPASTPPASPADSLVAEFQEFADRLGAKVGVALTAVGDTATPPVSLGGWPGGPAWSTIKVPLSIAALRGPPQIDVTDAMKAAIIRSDNAAADQVWQSLGAPDVAARKVEDVLRDAGAPATVPAERKRPEFSAFGQTDWSLTDQVRFLSWAKCNAAYEPIFDLMGRVESDQQWGLGVFDEWEIKGGWGPAEDGRYLVRQMGVITTPNGAQTAVAIAAEPDSGSFGDGTQVLTRLANWLKDRQNELPGGQCSNASVTTVSGPP